MVARELKRPGVTLMTLWEEYRESEPEGYGYSRFCDLFRSFERHLSPVMRQHHVAGDKVFVDFSGKRLEVIDPTSGMVRPAEIFVGVLGASSYTYAEAVWTQTLPDWIGAHSRMFVFWRGAAAGHPGICVWAHIPGYVPLTVMWPRPLIMLHGANSLPAKGNITSPLHTGATLIRSTWNGGCYAGAVLFDRIRSTAFGHPGSERRSSGTSAG